MLKRIKQWFSKSKAELFAELEKVQRQMKIEEAEAILYKAICNEQKKKIDGLQTVIKNQANDIVKLKKKQPQFKRKKGGKK
ncbi:hypothetical protein A4G18_00675 [Pasteurellaceae bacterium Pebbles2]|nr:hypothetical protein [Pasteurellaceae bacterium Pebbles2]